MRHVINTAHFLLFLLVFVHCVQDPYQNQPRILVEEGNLVFQTAINNNITFRSYGSGKIRVNNADLEELVKKAQESVASLETYTSVDAAAMSNKLNDVVVSIEQLTEVTDNFRELQTRLQNLTEKVNQILGIRRGRGRVWNLRTLSQKVRNLELNFSLITENLRRDECESNPCQNGGTCLDKFRGFTCLCPKNWQGSSCDEDVNECALFAGTELGCQNSATCINSQGSYECVCTPSWHGVHCTNKHDDCSNPGRDGRDLCLHGTCISGQRRYRNVENFQCICDKGWQVNNRTGACDVDINECSLDGPAHCSVNPRVPCYNYDGGFQCGHCPAGYEGNGQSCHDVNECLVNNGGCSLTPRVSCENTFGSFKCGPCPPGFVGDGRTCLPGVCSQGNGGCDRLATCVENNAVYVGYRECRCPSGYYGNGIGPNGCVASSSGGGGGGGGDESRTPCDNNPCIHGSCRPHLSTFTCVCYQGFSGPLCDQQLRACSSNPCQNGATCLDRPDGTFTCNCALGWQDNLCQTEIQSCGGRLTSEMGTIRYPINTGEQYIGSLDCPWVIYTQPGKVLNITFTYIDIEPSQNCQFDFLAFHDGESVSSPRTKQYCGRENPAPFVSTHNVLYILFRTDSSVHHYGFELNWNTTEPICGGNVTTNHGSITSPGYPGDYPNKRDCYWYIQVQPGKRLHFQFAHVAIERNDNCSFDFVRIYDGGTLNSPILNSICDTSTPPPMDTSGSHAVIHFHSDDSLRDKGFSLTYSSLPSVPGCGGVFTRDQGLIVSPNYPDRYENHLKCEWLIRVHPDEKIEIEFEEFNLENHRECEFDYLKIFDGGDENSNLFGTFCGSSAPQNILSSSNTLFIQFNSDESLTRDGFKAKYKTACGGLFTSLSGVLKSPYYPDNYPSNRVCSYRIELPVGKLVQLQFTDFDIEASEGDESCQFDCLEVLDSGSPNGTSLGHLCGTSIPEPITSTYNHLLVVFRTDASVRNKGFMANYSGIDTGCGGVLTEVNGAFSTPSHPVNYHRNLKCNWLIRGPPGFIVDLNFRFFELESHFNCTYDYVEIRDSDYHFLGRFCGTQKPPEITSTDRELYVIFQSDESISRQGFSARYELRDYTHHCGGNLRRGAGVIMSPGFPDHYPHDKECIWTIKVDVGKQIRLQFENFTTENHQDCRYDYLEIRNGGQSNSPLMGKFCGTRILKSLISHHHELYLKFKTDSSNSAPGFKLYYDSAITGCGGTLTTSTGILQSPSYPNPYGNSALCKWTFRVAHGSTISAVLVDVDIEPNAECEYDYLRLFDGDSDKDSPLSRKLCSSTQNPGTITSSNNVMHVIFQTDPSVNGRGFSLAYHANCNNVLKGIRGVIESPNFPDFYPHNYNCTWEIQAPQGNNISLAFSTLALENDTNCQYDRIEILRPDDIQRPGRPLSLVSVARFCGTPSPLPPPMLINSSKVYVQFISDDSMAIHGFRLEYAMIGCIGDFRKSYGDIKSPNYPNGYLPNLHCEWHITTEIGTIVKLYISEFAVEPSQGCVYDALHIYDGASDKANKITSLCHTQTSPSMIPATGNKMTLKFESDSSVTGKGFRLHYYSESRCSHEYRGLIEGTVNSKGYPDNYTADVDCRYVIRVDKNHLIHFEFLDFDIPYDPDCVNNYLQVSESYWNDDDEPLFKICNRNFPANYSSSFTSSGNILVITHHASGTVTGRGFKAAFKSVCGARILLSNYNNGEGTLTSPNYPHGAHNHYNCSWILTAGEEQQITLTFTNIVVFNSENCSAAFLEIRDGDSQDSPLIRRFCGNAVPHPITSRGNSLHVFMHSFGLFRATYSTSTSACGGDLTALEGTFNSPSYPSSYPPTTSCEWTIRSAPGNLVELEFSYFDLEESDNCNGDYLEIHETGPSGKSLGRYCGTNAPTNISAANVIWLKFRSDDSGSSGGFRATFILKHGMDLKGNTGEVASPTFPLRTFNGGVYKWTITVDPRLFVSITFVFFEINDGPGTGENCKFYLEIFDGPEDQGSTLGRFCGLRIPDPVVSKTNMVTLKFQTSTFHRCRWFIRWQAVNATFIATVAPPTSAPGIRCGEMIFLNRSENATVTSPGYPDSNFGSLNCTWIFKTIPTRHVALKINMTLASGSRNGPCLDYISVYDAVSLGAKWEPSPERAMCGIEPALNVTSFYSTGTSVRKMELNTPHRYRYRYLRKNFKAIAYAECGGYLTEPSGVIETLDGIRANGTEPCQWIIHVRRGRTIKIEFDLFNIQSETGLASCSSKYLELRNGGYQDSPPLGNGRYCGGNIPNVTESSSNKVFVILKNDFEPFFPLSTIFKLRYQELSLGCGGRLYLTPEQKSVTVSSPNYPNNPPHDVECEWIISSPLGTNIRIDVHNMFVDSEKCHWYYSESNSTTNFLDVYDGGTTNSHQIARICTHLDHSSIHSTSNVVLLRFVSTDDVTHAHFTTNVTISKCGGVLRNFYQLNSPNYPENYENNMDCEWILNSPNENHGIFGSFRDLNLPYSENCSTTDYVEVREESATGNLVGLYCGRKNDSQRIEFKVDLSKIYIKFHSNESGTGLGFKMSFYFPTLCSNYLYTSSGIFSSPQFPAAYPQARTCYWRIRASGKKRISVTFNQFNIPRHPITGKCVQYLQIISGALYRNVTNVPLCGNSISVIESIYGDIAFKFVTTTGLAAGEGFQAIYTTDLEPLCGKEILTGKSGYISSMIYEPRDAYALRMNCHQEISTSDGRANVTFGFTFIEFDNGNDTNCQKVTMEVGAIYDYDQSHQICRIPQSEILITSLIAFVTDYTYNSSVRYNISYKTYECGGTLNVPTTIEYNNFPNDTKCVWIVRATYGDQIQITFNETPDLGSTCDHNNLTIRNGVSFQSPVLAKYCTGQNSALELHSMSYAIKLILYADGTSSARGFNISFEKKTRGCGGYYQGARETISSPNHPQQYSSNQQCEWTIEMNPSYRVNISFSGRFDIEMTANCTKDNLLIEEEKVDDEQSKNWVALARLCGHETPKPIVATSHNVRITFTADDSNNGDGFTFSYYGACGGEYLEGSGYFTSPNYPENYNSHLECRYLIGRPNDYISLVFDEDFALESSQNCAYDSVNVYSGNESYGSPMAVYCSKDDEVAGERSFRHRGQLLVVLKTDSSMESSGFLARYSISSCGGNLTAPGAIITSPFYPKQYNRNLDCSWLITVPSNRAIELTVVDIELEGSRGHCSDYLYVYDGNRTSPNLRIGGRFCDDTTSFFKSRFNQMVVFFHSDYSIENNGFKAIYRTTYGERTGCGGTLQSATGTISSIDIDNDGRYEEGLNCVWTIEGEPNKVLKITFQTFDVEEVSGINSRNESDPCMADYLEIRDGFSGTSSLVGKFCGSRSPDELMLSSNRLWVHFFSDFSSTQNKGFSFTYTSETPLCGGLINVTNTAQTITTPNYPGNYPRNLRCEWVFAWNKTLINRVHMQITDFDLPCENDAYLDVVIQGMPTQAYRTDPTVHRYCGEHFYKDTFASQSLKLTLHTSSGAPRKGFSLTYKAADCIRNFTDDYGSIICPRTYSAFECNYTITAKTGRTISLYFASFRMSTYANSDCSNMFLRIYEGSSVNSSNLLLQECGASGLPSPIHSTSENLFIHFKRLNSARSRSAFFSISYTTTDKGQGCGGVLRAPSGAFYSPFYPSAYNKSSTCIWRIAVDSGAKVELVFPFYRLTSVSGCESNYIEIFNGNSEIETMKYSRFCGNERPLRMILNTNQALVKLVTNENNTDYGFQAFFYSYVGENVNHRDSDLRMLTPLPTPVPTRGGSLDSDNLQ